MRAEIITQDGEGASIRPGTAAVALCVGLLFLAALAAPAQAEELPTTLAECAACHGLDGIGRNVQIPHLAGQHEHYLYAQLQAFKSGKRAHKEMRYESRQLSDEEMHALAHYYAELPR